MVRLPGRGTPADTPSVPATGGQGTLDAAVGLYRAGMVPLPVRPGQKAPAFTREEPWQQWRWENEDQLRKRMRGKNVGVRCDSLVVVDTDNPEAEAYWSDRLGDLWDRTTAWVSSGGRKTAFRLPEGEEVAPWSRKARGEQTLEFDICSGSGKQVVVPPSTHPDGSSYRFLRDWESLMVLTPDQVELFERHQLPGQTAEEAESAGSMGAGSQLYDLCTTPPEERTNNWLTQLCGHLAKRMWPHYDAYLGVVQGIDDWSVRQGGVAARNQMKTIDSVWRRESAKQQAREEATDTGNLMDGEGGIWLELQNGSHHLWLGCHIETLLVIDADDKRFYRLRITGPASDRPKETTVEAWKLNSFTERGKLLAGLGYEVEPPTDKAKTPRLLAYVESQRAERGEAVPYLGWHGGAGFLGERQILVSDLLTQRQIAPMPDVVSKSAHVYGTLDSEDEVRRLLREVYTYQDPTVAAVTMSWWCMSLLKGRFITPVFPILCLEAVSGSGKTNGFFAFLNALAGNTRGAGVMTLPQVRNQLATVQNGIVWIDDTTDFSANMLELIRQAPTRGTVTKTGADNSTSEEYRLVGSLLLSCEGLGEKLHDKAYEDRTLFLELPPVSKRPSARTPGRTQWEDIVETLAAYGGEYKRVAERAAGTAVRLVHRYAELLARMPEMYPDGRGRHQEKAAILRMGAVIAAEVTGLSEIPPLVGAWLESSHEDQGQRNAFLKHILPRLLREMEDVTDDLARRDAIGILRDGDRLYVRPSKAADYWEKTISRSKNARENQLATAQAINRELDANGVGKAQNHRVNAEMVWCRKLTTSQSARAIQDAMR